MRVLRIQHFVNTGGARGFGPFKADGLGLMRPVCRQVHLVGGGDEALLRVDDKGQGAVIEEAIPFETAIARHRGQAFPVGAIRHEAGGCPGDIARLVGIEKIDRRRAPAAGRGAEIGQIAGMHHLQAGHVGRRPGREPDAAHGDRAGFFGIAPDHRAMAGEFAKPRLVGITLDRESLGAAFHRLKAIAIAITRGIGRVGLVDIDILLIGSEDRQAETRLAIMAHAEAWYGRFACADAVKPRRGEMDDIAQRGQGMGAMRVTGQDWRPRLRATAMYGPVV